MNLRARSGVENATNPLFPMNSHVSLPSVSRRRFISSSGTAAVGALAAGRLVFAQSSDTLKIALVGCGGRGSGAANQALNVPGTRLVAVADAFQDRLEGHWPTSSSHRAPRWMSRPSGSSSGLTATRTRLRSPTW